MMHEYLIVSGPHRSGTSMMMRMLEASGCPVDYDKTRDERLHNRDKLLTPDYHPNPNGFYEGGRLQPGVAVKRIARALQVVKTKQLIKLVFMDRNRDERKSSLKRWGHSGWHLLSRLETDKPLRDFMDANRVELVMMPYADTVEDPEASMMMLKDAGWPIRNPAGAIEVADKALYRHKVK